MPKLSRRSTSHLLTCDDRLVRIAEQAIEVVDFTILCGHRTAASQEAAFRAGRSQVRWPDSLHNKKPSLAMDFAPWPIDWHDRPRFGVVWGVLRTFAHLDGVKLKWGGDWGWDWGHVEIDDDGRHDRLQDGRPQSPG